MRLVKEVKLLGGHARRLEDRYAVGLLDLVIKLSGHDVVMAEGKIIHGNLFEPTPAQYIEGMKWIKVGVGVVLIGWQDRGMYISPWVKKADKRECFATAGYSYAESLLKYLNGELNAKDQDRGLLRTD